MSGVYTKQHKYWLGFNLVDGIGAIKFRALLDYFGTVEAAWCAAEFQLKKLGLDKRSLQNFLKVRQEVDLDLVFDKVKQKKIDLLTWQTDNYPPYLQEVDAPPPLLYVQGDLLPDDEWSIAIVGTRKLTGYGRQVARDITAGLVRKGITIVSGLARGVDTVAHKTALEMGGRTIAVLGSGLDQIYPPENRQLAQQIIEQRQGAVISEYSLGTRPHAKNFPPRNRIISGMTRGTVVIEGGIKSGSLITARFALKQNREVFAVPGNINSPVSAGPNYLIQQGAKLVTCAADVLEELNMTQANEQKVVQMVLPESAEEAAILPHIDHQGRHIDEICRASGLPSAQVNSTLMILELKGIVHNVGSMQYALAL